LMYYQRVTDRHIAYVCVTL